MIDSRGAVDRTHVSVVRETWLTVVVMQFAAHVCQWCVRYC